MSWPRYRQCAGCGKNIDSESSGNINYCSLSCYRNTVSPRYDGSRRTCLKCGDDIPERRQLISSSYCSDDCYFGHVNAAVAFQAESQKEALTKDEKLLQRDLHALSRGFWDHVGIQRRQDLQDLGYVGLTRMALTTKGHNCLRELNHKRASKGSDSPTTEEGTAMAVHTYSKEMLVRYANERLNEQREVLDEHTAGLRDIASTLLTDVENDVVSPDSLREELAKREQAFLEERAKAHKENVAVVRPRITHYEQLIRQLEAMSGDEVHLEEREFEGMRLL